MSKAMRFMVLTLSAASPEVGVVTGQQCFSQVGIQRGIPSHLGSRRSVVTDQISDRPVALASNVCWQYTECCQRALRRLCSCFASSEVEQHSCEMVHREGFEAWTLALGVTPKVCQPQIDYFTAMRCQRLCGVSPAHWWPLSYPWCPRGALSGNPLLDAVSGLKPNTRLVLGRRPLESNVGCHFEHALHLIQSFLLRMTECGQARPFRRRCHVTVVFFEDLHVEIS